MGIPTPNTNSQLQISRPYSLLKLRRIARNKPPEDLNLAQHRLLFKLCNVPPVRSPLPVAIDDGEVGYRLAGRDACLRSQGAVLP